AEALGEFHYEMVEACAFEDFCSRRAASRRDNVIDDYLDQRGWKESLQARDYLRALRGSLMSLYEVVEVKSERGLVLRDLVRGGEPVEVDEQLGSQSAAIWDRIAARVLTIGGRHYLSGAVLNFEQEPADAVLRVFRISPERAQRSIAERLPTLTEEQKRELDELLADRAIALEGGARVFAWIWLAHTLRQLRAPLPTLTNFDGEEVVFTKVRFAVAKEHRVEVARLLDQVPELAREANREYWSWHRQDGEQGGKRPEDGMSLASWDETGALVLGHMELRGKWLVLEVNSAARGERGTQMLMQLLGGLVATPVTETQSVQSALEEHRARKRSSAEEAAPKLPPEEAARVTRELVDRHYRRVIDEPLPALGNLPPREAVRTPAGRQKVIGWLKHLENGEGRRARKDATPPYDFSWMWRELGVLEERR
ncbi:MAG TPA: hypothetical protein VJX23_14830, partial [Candidatus Binataceae bacterium]|nr:hypothetical protein [Candidatus Binataceae bacterium]